MLNTACTTLPKRPSANVRDVQGRLSRYSSPGRRPYNPMVRRPSFYELLDGLLVRLLTRSRICIHGILQNPFKHRRRGCANDRAEGDEDADKNPACTIIAIAQHNE